MGGHGKSKSPGTIIAARGKGMDSVRRVKKQAQGRRNRERTLVTKAKLIIIAGKRGTGERVGKTTAVRFKTG